MDIAEILRQDFARNPRLLDRATVVAFRINQWAGQGRWSRIKKPFAKIIDLLWIQILVGAEMPGTVTCGPGLRLPHAGRGVILNGNSVIGKGVTLYHRVTLGQVGEDATNVPTLEDNVLVGAGASILGRVTVGAGSKIGAGAVVTRDVPPSRTAVGIPARVIDGSSEDRN